MYYIYFIISEIRILSQILKLFASIYYITFRILRKNKSAQIIITLLFIYGLIPIQLILYFGYISKVHNSFLFEYNIIYKYPLLKDIHESIILCMISIIHIIIYCVYYVFMQINTIMLILNIIF